MQEGTIEAVAKNEIGVVLFRIIALHDGTLKLQKSCLDADDLRKWELVELGVNLFFMLCSLHKLAREYQCIVEPLSDRSERKVYG